MGYARRKYSVTAFFELGDGLLNMMYGRNGRF
jgi:hypothetical protein